MESHSTRNNPLSPPRILAVTGNPLLNSGGLHLSLGINGTAKPAGSTSVGESILRGNASHIDPLQTNDETHMGPDHGNNIPPFVESSMKPPAGDGPNQAETRRFQPNKLPPLRPPQAYRTHRKQSDSTDIPQQTIMKALASRLNSSGTSTAPLTASMNSGKARRDEKTDQSASTSPCLTANLANRQINGGPTLSAAADLLLRSPCFFHQRLEGAVDMQRPLDEVSDEDYSHSRLMQTATTVRESAKLLQKRPMKQAVRSVMIVTKARDNKLVHLTRELAEWLLTTPRYGAAVGVKVYVDAKLRHSKRFDAAGLIRKDTRFQHMLKFWTPDLCWTSPGEFDLVLTLGGDGTVLFTSWLFQRVVPPILSFSMGSLGFLTNFSFDEYQQSLDRVMGDAGMLINLRMRFTCTVWRADRSRGAEQGAAEEGEQFEVLNELVIDRGPSPFVSNLELYGDDALLTKVQADGCIFSTPTGSTAYSLSAGGALVHPTIAAVLLTPICPHTLSFRPMLLPDTVAFRIVVPSNARSSVYCSFDGKGRIELNKGDYVTLEASQYPFPTVMTGPNEWLESVQRSLQWNTRAAEQKGWEEGQDENGPGDVWDIDTNSEAYGGTDSGLGQSEDGDPGTASPMRRQMNLLNM